MKKIWKLLKGHIKEDFHLSWYLSIALLLMIGIGFNYYFDFEDTYLERLNGLTKYLSYFVFYSIPYFSSIILWERLTKRGTVFRSSEFWMKSIFGLAILSLDASAPFLNYFIYKFFAPQTIFWAYKVSVNAMSFVTVFLPVAFYYWFCEKEKKHFYGLAPTSFDTKPYFTMVLIMLPLIVMASFNDSFLRQYPMYKTSSAHQYFGVDEWITAGIYEIAYGLDFVTVEYLFRGFFVIGLISSLGRASVLSMAVVYCVLHFGKPMGEAISSIFGGYILGVVAYETRSVWGGVIVHMGIAWAMELAAFIQKQL